MRPAEQIARPPSRELISTNCGRPAGAAFRAIVACRRTAGGEVLTAFFPSVAVTAKALLQ